MKINNINENNLFDIKRILGGKIYYLDYSNEKITDLHKGYDLIFLKEDILAKKIVKNKTNFKDL